MSYVIIITMTVIQRKEGGEGQMLLMRMSKLTTRCHPAGISMCQYLFINIILYPLLFCSKSKCVD